MGIGFNTDTVASKVQIKRTIPVANAHKDLKSVLWGGFSETYPNSSLFVNGATYNDFKQGRLGSCSILASMSSFTAPYVVQKHGNLIEQLITQESQDTFKVKLYDQSFNAIFITLNDDIPFVSGIVGENSFADIDGINIEQSKVIYEFLSGYWFQILKEGIITQHYDQDKRIVPLDIFKDKVTFQQFFESLNIMNISFDEFEEQIKNILNNSLNTREPLYSKSSTHNESYVSLLEKSFALKTDELGLSRYKWSGFEVMNNGVFTGPVMSA